MSRSLQHPFKIHSSLVRPHGFYRSTLVKTFEKGYLSSYKSPRREFCCLEPNKADLARSEQPRTKGRRSTRRYSEPRELFTLRVLVLLSLSLYLLVERIATANKKLKKEEI